MEKEKTYREVVTEKVSLEDKNKKQIDRFAEYQQMRVDAHGQNLPAPIYKGRDGVLKWANRAQRRKNKK